MRIATTEQMSITPDIDKTVPLQNGQKVGMRQTLFCGPAICLVKYEAAQHELQQRRIVLEHLTQRHGVLNGLNGFVRRRVDRPQQLACT